MNNFRHVSSQTHTHGSSSSSDTQYFAHTFTQSDLTVSQSREDLHVTTHILYCTRERERERENERRFGDDGIDYNVDIVSVIEQCLTVGAGV